MKHLTVIFDQILYQSEFEIPKNNGPKRIKEINNSKSQTHEKEDRDEYKNEIHKSNCIISTYHV